VIVVLVMIVLMVMRMVIHAGPGRVTERGAGRMLTIVGLMVVLSFDRERQHGTARRQLLPASLVHSTVSRSRVAHPTLNRQSFVINYKYNCYLIQYHIIIYYKLQ